MKIPKNEIQQNIYAEALWYENDPPPSIFAIEKNSWKFQ